MMPPMQLGLRDRVALVTGASQGIGRGIAASLVAEGARVAVTSRSRERIDAAAQAIGARPYVLDAADLDAIPDVVAAVESDLGPIDVYVANTGGPPPGQDPLGFTREQWEAAHRTLLLAPMTVIERVLPGMRDRGWGRVVAIGSTAVIEPIPTIQLSNAHRPGLVAAFKVLARRAAADGVTFNTVHPGRIATARMVENAGSQEAAEALAAEQIPAGRLGTVDELAAAATFLCSEPAGYITGTAIVVDGGLTVSI
jgi:3-oxoacyl-[acyl-carrier protein] reductase